MTKLNNNQIIQSSFGKQAASKGRNCWQQDRVLHFEVQDLPEGTQVEGEVKGRRRQPYTVTLDVTADENDAPDNQPALRLSGHCNCPQKHNCPHSAALAYAWLSRQAPANPSSSSLGPPPQHPVPLPSENQQLEGHRLYPGSHSDERAEFQSSRRSRHEPSPRHEPRPAARHEQHPLQGPESHYEPRDLRRDQGRDQGRNQGRDQGREQRRDDRQAPRKELRHKEQKDPRKNNRNERLSGSPQLRAWLGRLRKTSAPGVDQPPRLLYLLSFHDNQARIELRVPEPRRRGGKHSKGNKRPTRHEPLGKLLGPQSRHSLEDMEIGKLLLGQVPPGPDATHLSSLTLSGNAGALALDLMLASGRCRLQSPGGARLGQGEARELDFIWVQNGRGWQLQPVGTPPVKQVFQLDGPWYFDDLTCSLGPLDTPLEPELVDSLLQAPTLPRGDVEAAHEALLQLAPELELVLPKGVRQEVEKVNGVEPIPQLVLRGLPREGRDPLYVAQLAFDYAGAILQPSKDEVAMRLQQHGKVYLLRRELEAEEDWRQQLPETALEPLADRVTFVLPGDGNLAQAQAWEYWLRVQAPALEDQGWDIQKTDDFSLKVYSGESDWEASITNDEKGEWFDLSLGIEIDGKQVNLLALLEGLLRSASDPQELLERLAKEEYLLLPVGAEQWLRVPSVRVRGMLATLIELYDENALNADGSLRLNWHQGLGLGHLLDDPGVNWEGGDHLRTLATQLQDFSGLTHVPLPAEFKTTLRPYQQEGLNWLQFLRNFGFHGILADDMGLGKTIQTLAHLLIEKQSGRADLPSLVVAPTSVIPNWRREAEKFAPDLKVLVLHGPERAADFERMAEADLILTTYALIRIDLEHYLQQAFHLVILDEAQMIKNPLAKTAQAVCRLEGRHRLALSGTPVENHLEELWSIFRFLMKGFLGTSKEFNQRYRAPIEKLNDQLRAQALRQRLRPFLLRRTKLEVAGDLPPKSEMVQYVELSGAQRDLYETIRVALDQRVREEINKIGLKRSQLVLLDALLKLRQICCDPRLPKLEEAKKVKDSAKLDWLLETVPEMVEEGRRILIFSQFVSMLDLIEAGLAKQNVNVLRLTGATRKRESTVDAFQRGDAPVFLVSLKAGGVGINLTAADTVIHYDPWWNPAAENQATDRAWRIGQDKPVFVYKLICEQTVEEKILQLQQKKAQISEGIFTEGESGLKIDAEELLALLES